MPQVQIIQPIQPQAKRLRVAAYARVSSDSADQLNSMSTQVDYYTHLIQDNPQWEFAGVYADEGISGTGTRKREQFNRLMEDCRIGLIDRVLVKSASRFARNTADALASVRELKSLGVTVAFEKEGFDTETANGEMLLSMICAVAQEESLSISKNMKWGIRKRMESGNYHTSSVPYGYKQVNFELVPVSQQVDTVKHIYEWFLQGKSTTEIADALNHLHPDTSKIWYHTTVERILKNEKYIGCSLCQKSYTSEVLPFKRSENSGELPRYYAQNTHSPIISQDDFNKVQTLLQRKSVGTCPRVNTTFSKMLYCAKCGSILSRKVNRSSQVTWVCRTHLRCAADCPTPPIREENIQRAFLYMHNKLVRNNARIFEPMLKDFHTARNILETKEENCRKRRQHIQQLAKKMHNLSRLYEKGAITSVQYWERRTLLERESVDEKSVLSTTISDSALLRVLTQTKQLYEHYATAQPLQIFDDTEFDFSVKRVLIDCESCTFQLKNGMKLKEML